MKNRMHLDCNGTKLVTVPGTTMRSFFLRLFAVVDLSLPKLSRVSFNRVKLEGNIGRSVRATPRKSISLSRKNSTVFLSVITEVRSSTGCYVFPRGNHRDNVYIAGGMLLLRISFSISFLRTTRSRSSIWSAKRQSLDEIFRFHEVHSARCSFHFSKFLFATIL